MQLQPQVKGKEVHLLHHFHIEAELEARQGDEIVHTEKWSKDFPRNHN